MIREAPQDALHDTATAALSEARYEIGKKISPGRDDREQWPDPGSTVKQEPTA